jgi:glycosyltransferase involved in cell wall biosynthesis
VRAFGGGNVYLRGAVAKPSQLYNSISLYVNPAATTGFDLGVLEAAAHGRPVLCSDAAGAAEHASEAFTARSPEAMASAINLYSSWNPPPIVDVSALTWPRIRERYKQLWRSVLAPSGPLHTRSPDAPPGPLTSGQIATAYGVVPAGALP